ncbi:helix-turn-helix domain-containing protein [Enterococcus sp. 2201sp1_2201st1_B8_2201SCRN_220225]|uniref:helix-turn-helix domain-containing protein n=1 Tax=unclassified Enterococcus TaxID=2608891 RepID=UPI0034A3510D
MNEKPEWLKKITNLPEINQTIKFFGGHQQRVSAGWKAERETHFAFEIMIILEGVQHSDFTSFAFDYPAGSILLIPPGLSHENSCGSKEGMRYFCVHFDIDDPEIQQNLLMYCPLLLQADNEGYDEIRQVLLAYVALLDKDTFTLRERLLVERLLIDLLIGLLDYAQNAQKRMESSDSSTLVLGKAIADTIQTNFRTFTQYPQEENRELLTMKNVADGLSISESTMLKVFKKVFFHSPKQYLDELRFNEAKFLLHQPKLAVGEIAEVIGYQNASHFSRQFKRWSGLSPNEYREMNRTQSEQPH